MSYLLFKWILKHCLYVRSHKTEIKLLAIMSAYLRVWGEYLCSFRLFAEFSYCGYCTEVSLFAGCWLGIIFSFQRLPAFHCSWSSSSTFEASNGRLSPSQTLSFSLATAYASSIQIPFPPLISVFFFYCICDSSKRTFSAFKGSCN